MVWPTECNLSRVAEAGRSGSWEASGRLRKGLGQGLAEPQHQPTTRRAPSAAVIGS